MPISNDLIERTADLKGELVEFAIQPRFNRVHQQALDEQFGPDPILDEGELANYLDWFILQERLPDGRTPLEHFVAEHPELPEEEQTMLLAWLDVVEGIFEVKKRDGEALVIVNIMDELTYRVRSNMGPDIFRQMPRGSFIEARVVPVSDEWLISGMVGLLPDAPRDEVYLAASEIAMRFPEMVFRNPEKLARAWELQREERQHFLDFFETDLVIIPGHELNEEMQDYLEFRLFQAPDDEGRTAADRFREAYGVEPPAIQYPLPDEFHRAESVGIFYDEVEGLNLYINFGQVAAVFANPELAGGRRGRQAVMRCLEDPSISPLPLRRLAEQDPARASEVFQRVLKLPGFSWEQSGETILRQYKAEFYNRPALPSIVPLTQEQTMRHLSVPKQEHPKPNFRPARRGRKRR